MRGNGNLPPGVTDKMIEDQWGRELDQYAVEIEVDGRWDLFRVYWGDHEGFKEAGNDFDVLAKGFFVRFRNMRDGEIEWANEVPLVREAV